MPHITFIVVFNLCNQTHGKLPNKNYSYIVNKHHFIKFLFCFFCFVLLIVYFEIYSACVCWGMKDFKTGSIFWCGEFPIQPGAGKEGGRGKQGIPEGSRHAMQPKWNQILINSSVLASLTDWRSYVSKISVLSSGNFFCLSSSPGVRCKYFRWCFPEPPCNYLWTTW